MKSRRTKRFRKWISVILTFSCIFSVSFFSPGAGAVTRFEAEQAQRENQARQHRLQAELEGVNQELAQVVLRLDKLENETIPQAQAEVEATESAAAAAQLKAEKLRAKLQRAQEILQQLETSIAQAGQESDNARAGIVKLARQQIKGQTSAQPSAPESLGLNLVDAENSEQYIRALESDALVARILSRIFDNAQWIIATGSNEQDRMDQIRAVIAQLTIEAEESARQAESLAQTAREKRAELQAFEQELVQAQAEYQASQAEIENQKAAAEEEARKLNQLIAQIAAQEQTSGAPSGPAPSSGFFGWPLGTINITQYFGGMTPSGEFYNPSHDAVDFGAACGTPVFASAPGTIAAATQDWSGNIYVLVNHGILGDQSFITSYNHLTSFIVGKGQAVAKGEVIGYVGSTGWSTGCHLHFALAVNGVNVDPLGYLG